MAVSASAGLVWCTRFTNPDQAERSVTLSANDPNRELCEVMIPKDAELILHSRFIVAITNGVNVSSVWRIRSLHAWLTLQLRYLRFSGPGRIYVAAPRGISQFDVSRSRVSVEQHVLVGFEPSLAYSVGRTETFVPYLLGQATLFEDRLAGEGVVLKANASKERNTIVEKTVGVIFSIVGKAFGF